MNAIAEQPDDQPLNVLHLCAGNLFGGVERYLLTLQEFRAAEPQMRPVFALCYEGQLSARLREMGGDVRYIGPTRLGRPWSVWFTRRRIRSLMRELGHAVVLSHGCWPHAVVGTAAKYRVIYLHDAIDGSHWLERRAMANPAMLAIANSAFTASRLPKLAFGGALVERLTYPSQLPTFAASDQSCSALRESLQTANSAVVIVMPSRWEPYKGHELLVEALAHLPTHLEWVLWIAGGAQRPAEEAFRDRVMDLARSRGIDMRIRLLGQRDDIPQVLASADVHCQPNLRGEPFGLTFVEGLAAGLPVVTTRIGGGEEILAPDYGVLTEPGDPRSLAEALARLIESPERRNEYAIKGPARARELCNPVTQIPALYRALAEAVRRSDG